MFVLCLLLWFLTLPVSAHTVEHRVDQQSATVVTMLFADGEEASFSEYEIKGPDGSPFQTGRTDLHGRVAFLPDRAGKWQVSLKADSQHGLHGVKVDVEIGADKAVQAYSKPVVATHTRLLVGVGILLGIFGALALLRPRRSARAEGENPGPG